MYKDAARRVVFHNCMSHCEVSNEELKNFNGQFYFAMDKERQCLGTCFNAKMLLHFGDEAAKKDGLNMDFDKLKTEYQRLESWNPNMRVLRPYATGYAEQKVDTITQSLLEKTKRSQQRY